MHGEDEHCRRVLTNAQGRTDATPTNRTSKADEKRSVALMNERKRRQGEEQLTLPCWFWW
jgi:hypothetical protein